MTSTTILKSIFFLQVKPPVDRTMDNDDLNRFIKKSNDDIDYHYNTGNYKLVAMNTEVVGATVMGIVRKAFSKSA